jgi:hypothetical protein
MSKYNTDKLEKHCDFSGTVRTYDPDLTRSPEYFAGLGALLREARCTNDPRVLHVALEVLVMQPAVVYELLGGEL